jgi:cytochrome d ubiquinol oxidase subunit I
MPELTPTFWNPLMLSRLQFAFTAMFHIIWPVLTIGLSLFLVVMEVLWLKTREEHYYRHARFWGKLFALNFSIGVVTGIPLEFQFGTNWSAFSVAGGDVFGHLLGFEAAIAFMLEAAFLGIMLFGWKRVSPRMHLLATAMVCLGSFLSGYWIMVANSWMQTPTGGYLAQGRFVMVDQWASIMNPDALWGVSHMLFAAVEVSLFVVGGISAWYLLKKRHVDFFLTSFKIAVLTAILVAPLQIFLGDGAGRATAVHQPAKLAAVEAHWETNPAGTGAPWRLMAWPLQDEQRNLWEIKIPFALSLLITHSPTGMVTGLKAFPREDQPPVWPPFLAFRVMLFLGGGFVALTLWTVWVWYRGGLAAAAIAGQKRLLTCWIIALPASYIAMEAGWIVREVGRQPWAIYGLVRTAHSASPLPLAAVATSLLLFVAFYAVLGILFLVFARKLIVRGPDGM